MVKSVLTQYLCTGSFYLVTNTFPFCIAPLNLLLNFELALLYKSPVCDSVLCTMGHYAAVRKVQLLYVRCYPHGLDEIQ